MVRFLNTSAVNFFLEDMIKSASERLIIISPFLKFNDRIKELLEDKDRLKIDVRIVYGKSELSPREINWLKELEFVRTSFCQNLHAKCYMNEKSAIITSMNLYDFSQQNNNEMGVFFTRDEESELYRETYEEANRLIRISELVRLSAEEVKDASVPPPPTPPKTPEKPQAEKFEKLTTSKLAKALGLAKTADLNDLLVEKGYLEEDGENLVLTPKGQNAGGESCTSKRFGQYFIWPKEMKP